MLDVIVVYVPTITRHNHQIEAKIHEWSTWERYIPRCSMYVIFAYIGVILGVNVNKYSSTMEHLGLNI